MSTPTISFTDEFRKVKVNFYGRWKKIKGQVIKIRGYEFIFTFVNHDKKNVVLSAYCLDSLSLFDSSPSLISKKEVSANTYMKMAQPLALKISIALNSMTGGAKAFKPIFKLQRKEAEIECNRD